MTNEWRWFSQNAEKINEKSKLNVYWWKSKLKWHFSFRKFFSCLDFYLYFSNEKNNDDNDIDQETKYALNATYRSGNSNCVMLFGDNLGKIIVLKHA